MLLLYFILAIIWILVFLILGSQVIYPMFSDAEFFWFFRYGKLVRKHSQEFDEKQEKLVETEIVNEIKRGE